MRKTNLLRRFAQLSNWRNWQTGLTGLTLFLSVPVHAFKQPNRDYHTNYLYNAGSPSPLCTNTDSIGHTFPTPVTCPTIMVSPPPVGGSYIDPTFHNRVRVVSDDGRVNSYSNPSALSATGKYAALSAQGFSDIVDTQTGHLLRQASSSQDWGFEWDPRDDDHYYVPARLPDGRMVMRKESVTDLAFSEIALDAGLIPTIWNGGTGALTSDGWFAFTTVDPNAVGRDPSLAAQSKICAAPLDGSNRLFCSPTDSIYPGWVKSNGLDWFLLTDIDEESGKRYMAIEPWGVIVSVDEAAGNLHFEYAAPELPVAVAIGQGNGNGICEPGEPCVHLDHTDTFRVQLANGKKRVYIYVGMEWESVDNFGYMGQGAFARLNTTADRFLDEMVPIMDVAVTGHPSCSRFAPVCTGWMGEKGGVQTSDVISPPAPDVFTGEIVAVKLNSDLSVDVRRVVKFLSYDFTAFDYYSFPRPGIIPSDGSRVFYTSNFGKNPATTPRRTAMADTGFGASSGGGGGSPPVISIPASVHPNPVDEDGAQLSVLGSDDKGEAALSYLWSTTGASPATVSFFINGSHAAKNTLASFSKAGLYHLMVTAYDTDGLSVTSTVDVTVNVPTTKPFPQPGSTLQPNINAVPGALAPRVYPNPWRKDRHAAQDITFANVSAGITIKIFTTSGHLVRELTAGGVSVTWDRKNDKGDFVASGIYVYLIKDSQGNQARGKLAVVK